MLLNEQHVARLRQSASTAHQRHTFRGPILRVRYSGGPLDGVVSIVEPSTASNRYLGWCVVHDRLGPITAMYERTTDPTVWNFRNLELGVQ